jgi:hypothetical protein
MSFGGSRGARRPFVFVVPLRPDMRRIPATEDPRATCRRCAARIVVLPDDRRLGYCFDCYDPSEVRPAAY